MITRPLAAALGVLASGCAATEPRQPAHADHTPPVVIDGQTGEWAGAAPVEVRADDRHLFVRFAPAETRHALQAAPVTTRILIDADNDPATGMALAGLGVDAAVLLSPPNKTGVGIGTEVVTYDARGFAAPAGHAELGFYFLPTHTARQYEARVDRARLPRSAAGRLTVRVDQIRPDAEEADWAAQAGATLPPPAAGPARPDAALPAKPAGAARVLALNVLHSAPLTNPDAFRRTIRAIDPDVILFQEWFNTAQPAIQEWAAANLGRRWTVFAPSENGIAVATRHRVIETVPGPLPGSGPGSRARFAAAVVETPAGPVIAGSLHLKCCGGAGTAEDLRRIDEATSINATLADVLARHPDAGLAVGGDYNLVGTRTPLETVARGLGVAGVDLVPVTPLTLGDPAAVTWVDEKSRFAPSRLDWILIDPARLDAARAFSLDTRRLAPATLQRLGLEAEDSHATDHLPIVVDLVAPKTP
jgi:endonuclease/exonuclease/phosphatase family metal-dependent hydrolase